MTAPLLKVLVFIYYAVPSAGMLPEYRMITREPLTMKERFVLPYECIKYGFELAYSTGMVKEEDRVVVRCVRDEDSR